MDSAPFRDFRWEPAARKAVLLLALALLVGLGCSTVYRCAVSKAHRSDYTVYTAAGRAVIDGEDIYEAHNVRGWYYMYLPIFAVAMVPFALLPLPISIGLWYLLTAASVGIASALCARMARRVFPNCRWSEFWLTAAILAMILPPLLSGMARGQVSPLMMALIAACLWFHLQNRHAAAGLALAACTVLKIFPILLFFYLLAKKQFRTAGWTAFWLATLVFVIPMAVFGPARNHQLLRKWVTTIALPANQGMETAAGQSRFEQMANPRTNRNQSVQAVAIRMASGRIMDVPAEGESIARPAAAVFSLLLVAVSVWACWRGRDERSLLLHSAILVLLMLFVPPVSWTHNYALAAIPIGIALAGWQSPAEVSRRWLGWGLAAYLAGGLLGRIDYFEFFGSNFWGAVGLWTALVAASRHARYGARASTTSCMVW